MALMDRCSQCESLSEFRDWFVDLEGFVRATEAALDLHFPLPDLRSSTGFFGGLRLGRQWLSVLGDLALPNPIPSAWTTPESEEG
jgi:hypothetical protein